MATSEEKKTVAVKDIQDWSNKDEIITTFPFYVREQFRKERMKGVTNKVDIEYFTLKTPYGDKVLFKNTHFHLEPNKRTCLFGGNGSGKTSLFKAIVSGQIKEFPTHLHTYHCKELTHTEDAESVLDTVMHSYPYLNTLFACEEKIKEALEKDPSNAGLQENLKFVDMQIRGLQGRTAEKRAVEMLSVLGFDKAGQQLSTNDLSGGLRMRVALAMAFFINPGLLLLDEPTNHLDFPSVLWLENRLRGYRGSFLLVTHDRDLLENVCTGVILLEDQKMIYYDTNFKAFEKQKAKEDKQKDARIDKFIDKNRNADPSTQIGRTLYDMRKWRDAYQQRLVSIQGKFTFPVAKQLPRPEGLADDAEISLINLQNVRFSYNPDAKDPVFIFNKPISINITTSSRLGIMGPNGAGKSTLLKLLTGKLTPTEGKVDTAKFKLAYFGQHSTAELNMKHTPSEFMQASFPKAKSGLLKAHLTKAGVIGDVQQTRMKNLSYSQRSCVIFAKLTFVAPHLLIMDEPTNFLDLASVDSLVNACNKFQGALLVVTHSRAFLKKCAKGYVSVVPGRFEFYDGMKEAEQATYTFISEMENGEKVGAEALAAGGGSMSSMASQVSAERAAELQAEADEKAAADAKGGYTDSDGNFVITKKKAGAIQKKKVVKKVIKKPEGADEVPTEWKVGMVGEALWTDGMWYAAKVQKLNGAKIQIKYIQYGNSANVPAVYMRKSRAVQKASGDSRPQSSAGGKNPRAQKRQNRNNNSRSNPRSGQQKTNTGGQTRQSQRQNQNRRTPRT